MLRCNPSSVTIGNTRNPSSWTREPVGSCTISVLQFASGSHLPMISALRTLPHHCPERTSLCDKFSTTSHHNNFEMRTIRIRQLKCSLVHFSQIHQDCLTFAFATLVLGFDETVLFHVSPFPTVIAVPIKCFACLPLATFAFSFAIISFAFA